ncbi:MAG: PAS domain S-box protein, partial [Methanoregulaceae archaeon]|nr:PAS domain S-box protein [Methanoregulaceae archaeon]
PGTAAENIIRTMPDGLILADADMTIVTANQAAAKIFREQEKDLPGRSISTLLPAATCTVIRDTIREKGLLSDLEAVLERDEYAVVSIAGSRVSDPGGEPAGIVLIVRDITSRKASERALHLASEKISQLSLLTSHDISNLVTALHGYLVLLKNSMTDPVCNPYIASSIGILEKITRHLQFSRQYHEIGSHQPIWQPLAAMIDKAARDVPHERVGIVSHVTGVEVYADPLAGKVVYNLLENALRHGEHLTTILISAQEGGGGEFLVFFEDNGTGIAECEKERIFSRGYGKNTGIGLSLSREILSVTGIGIVENGVAGRGARFEIRIPPGAWRYLAGPFRESPES